MTANAIGPKNSPQEVNNLLLEKWGIGLIRFAQVFAVSPVDQFLMTGLTLLPKSGRDASAIHDGKDILVRVARRVLRDHKSEQARSLAEELYGHAFLYITGKPFEHEPPGSGGFVNSYIDKIRARKY